MAVHFTPDQQRVIDTRDCNILVSAAAEAVRLRCWWSASYR